MTNALDTVLGRLERVRKARDRNDFIASCPVPDHGQGRGDRNPSLAIRYTDGAVLLNCHGGCHKQDVMLALGLEFTDLFDEPLTGRGVTVASWTYTNRRGEPYLIVERIEKPGGNKSYAQKLPGHVKYGLPRGFQHVIYKLPQVLAAIEDGKEVWIVEGEKCVSAAERLGLVATTNPGGAGKWLDRYGDYFVEGRGCVGVNIVCDNDEVGRKHAAEVAVSLRTRDVPVRTWRIGLPGAKADLYDHVRAGLGVDDLVPVNLHRLRTTGVMNDCLDETLYPDVRWTIRQVLPSGLAVLAGPPKMGKSLMAMDMALGVACGGRALSELTCEQGSVLYLSLDNDSMRRLQHRMRHLLGYQVPPRLPVEYHCDWSTGETAITWCQEWLDDERVAKRTPRLIVVDTLARVEPFLEGGPYDNAYTSSVTNLAKWARFADDNEVTVLMIHHDRKAGDEDWMNRFTGSRGITATASTLMLIDSPRGSREGHLRIAGRDVETDDLELRRVGWGWKCLNPNQPLHVVNDRSTV